MLEKIYTLFILELLFITGWGINLTEVKILGIGISFLLIIVRALKKDHLEIPKYFFIYLIFVVLIGLSIFWTGADKKTYDQLLLYINGGLFWIIFRNLPEKQINFFKAGLVVSGILFAIVYLRSIISDRVFVNPMAVFSPVWYGSKHIHLGDYWMLCLIIIVSHLFSKTKLIKKILYFALFAFGAYCLVVSSSRSAILGLMAGLYYLFSEKVIVKKYRKYEVILIALLFAVFIFVSSGRTTLFSRGYFFQGIAGIVHNPLGVGMGNFYEISSDPENHILGFKSVSGFAHNLIIEVFAGLGVFALVFLYWFFKISGQIFKSSGDLFSALFIALGVNFMFDFTYSLPLFLWLWFAFLGLSEALKEKEFESR